MTQELPDHTEQERAESGADFNKWLNKPLIRKLVSEVPECDFIEALLKDCFDAGIGAGMMRVIRPLMDKDRTPLKEPSRAPGRGAGDRCDCRG